MKKKTRTRMGRKKRSKMRRNEREKGKRRIIKMKRRKNRKRRGRRKGEKKIGFPEAIHSPTYTSNKERSMYFPKIRERENFATKSYK